MDLLWDSLSLEQLWLLLPVFPLHPLLSPRVQRRSGL